MNGRAILLQQGAKIIFRCPIILKNRENKTDGEVYLYTAIFGFQQNPGRYLFVIFRLFIFNFFSTFLILPVV